MRKDHKRHYFELYEYYLRIRRDKDIHHLKDIYAKIKELTPYYYNNGKISKRYNELIDLLMKSESLFNGKYILNKKINIDKNLKITKDSSKEEILDYIVNETRIFISDICKAYGLEPHDINEYSFESMCGYASFKVVEICNELNIKSYPIIIEPGYIKESPLFEGSNHHYCVIIELDNEYYLVDCTYKQFFKLGKTQIDRLGIVNCSPPRVGAYMTMNDERKKLSEEILEKGYTKLTKEKFKNYMDGFTISFRNGLYYEDTKDLSFEPKYTTEDYIRFLEGKDSQICYESRELLGFQRKPLNDNKMIFKINY